MINQPFGSGLIWRGSIKKWVTIEESEGKACQTWRSVRCVDKAFRIFNSMPKGSYMLCSKTRLMWEK